MASHTVRSQIRLSSSILLLTGCCLFFSAPANGQPGGNGAKARMQDGDRRELQLRDPGRGKRRETDPKLVRALMDQVNEDFQRLLTLHNEIVRSIARNDSPNYQFILEATVEIKKRAARLQSTLELRKPETSETRREKQAGESVPTKEDLIVLCRKIESFIKNPIIETPGTVDALQLDKARRDLESVVELSAAIAKRAEKQKH